MANRKIGENEFDVMRGRPQKAALVLESSAVAGQNYKTDRLIGTRAPDAVIDTVKYVVANGGTLAENIEAEIDSEKALVGTAVSITDSLGIVFTNVRILNVEISVKAVLRGAAEAAGKIISRWTVRAGNPAG